MRKFQSRFEQAPAKPAGGFRFISVLQLVLAWWCYKQGLIRLVDLRVYFACQEAAARRQNSERQGIPSEHNFLEIARLAGLSLKRAKESIKKLQAAGLLVWSVEKINFAASPDAVPLEDLSGFWALFHSIANNGRQVPVPRRIMRLLASGARPALIAAILGHLLRCLYYRNGRCEPRGRVKSSWIASTFGVDLRRVKEARAQLIEMGWLIALEAGQTALNRWGKHLVINLNWSRLDRLPPRPQAPKESGAAGAGRESCPSPLPSPASAASSPPAAQTRASETCAGTLAPAQARPEAGNCAASANRSAFPPGNPRVPDQKPSHAAYSGPGGACERSDAHNHPSGPTGPENAPGRPNLGPTAPASRAAAQALPSPTLKNVRLEDLKDSARLLILFELAVQAGLVSNSERDRLRFFAAAEHALAVGTKNPPGLFMRIVRSKLWRFITQDDEDAANERLKRHFFAKPASASNGNGSSKSPLFGFLATGQPAKAQTVELSQDAKLVKAVSDAARRAGFAGDPYFLLRREQSDWTRERWDAALREIELARIEQQRSNANAIAGMSLVF